MCVCDTALVNIRYCTFIVIVLLLMIVDLSVYFCCYVVKCSPLHPLSVEFATITRDAAGKVVYHVFTKVCNFVLKNALYLATILPLHKNHAHDSIVIIDTMRPPHINRSNNYI
jgi:hypothetical protein